MNFIRIIKHLLLKNQCFRRTIQSYSGMSSSWAERKIYYAGRNSSWLPAHILPLGIFVTLTFATKSYPQSKIWDGYLQSRFTDDYQDATGFSIRRAKLWVTGQVPVPGNWLYKVQGIFSYQNVGSFTFKDQAQATGTEEEILSEFLRIRDEIQNKFQQFYQQKIVREN